MSKARSRKGTGGIVKRGKGWRIRFEIGRDPNTGRRRTEYMTVHGDKADAQAALTSRLKEVREGAYAERSAKTVAEFASHWIDIIAPAKTGKKTRERYRELIEKHIVPSIGGVQIQKLDGIRIDQFYRHLATAGRRDGKGGLSPQTVLHIHRLLSQILKSAIKAKKLARSPMIDVQTTPRVRREEIQILSQPDLTKLYKHLKGRRLYLPVLVAANTGMRRGEILAVRWKDLGLDSVPALLRVAQVVEEADGEVSLKEPKTDRSRRTITLPATLVAELRVHRSQQAAWRLQHGLGKDPRDLVFPHWDGVRIWNPSRFSKEFAAEVAAAKLPPVTFHALRHSHVSDLLQRGVPVHVVSARAGHASATLTLTTYAHVLAGQQEEVAIAIDAALRSALEE